MKDPSLVGIRYGQRFGRSFKGAGSVKAVPFRQVSHELNGLHGRRTAFHGNLSQGVNR